MKRVVAAGKPVVLVLLNGSAVAVNWAREHVPSIVELWYPGQAGGTALADVLFGDYNPAGRLPVTFYKSAAQLPAFTDYNMQGRTYRYFGGEPLFPFGYGLSYTTFAYRNLRAPKNARGGDEIQISVEVVNTGKMAGEEVVQLYVNGHGPGAPIRSLAGFRRVTLAAGEKKTIQLVVPAPRTAGTLEISIGGRQPGTAIASTSGVVTGKIAISGTSKGTN
jgi:beta-glucosidase